MAVTYLSVMRSSCEKAVMWVSRRRGFLTLCGNPIQHQTEENQDSVDSAKPRKCTAENAMQHKMPSNPCASQKMLQLQMNELAKEHQTLQACMEHRKFGFCTGPSECSLQENYKKVVARVEDDNRRIRKCVEDARLYGIQSFCKDVVAVADILEKTTKGVTREDLANSNPTLKNLYEGLCLIDEKLCKIFSKHGLEKMNSIGVKYNSAEHEIVLRVPSVEASPGTVVKIMKEGYKLHGRILRTAQVGLAIEAQPHFKER